MPGASRTGRLFALLAESLRGSNRDLTSGPLAPAVFALAVPMVLEMVGESVFAVVDALFIARLGAPSPPPRCGWSATVSESRCLRLQVDPVAGHKEQEVGDIANVFAGVPDGMRVDPFHV